MDLQQPLKFRKNTLDYTVNSLIRGSPEGAFKTQIEMGLFIPPSQSLKETQSLQMMSKVQEHHLPVKYDANMSMTDNFVSKVGGGEGRKINMKDEDEALLKS